MNRNRRNMMELEEVEVREPLIVNRETRDLSGNESE